MRSSRWIPVALAFVLLFPLASSADWPHQRTESDESLPDGDLRLETRWTVPLGSGYSAIVVEGERAVTSFADGEGSDVVAAFAVDSGRELWRARLDRTYEGHSGSQDGPVATPTLAHGRVYMVSPHGALAAFALDDGHELWRRHLVDDLGATVPGYGIGATPVVAGDIVVIETRVEGKGAVHGFDAASGELRWSAVDDTVGYQAPILALLSGHPTLVAITNHWASGLDPASGEILWQARHTEEANEGISQPVIVRADDREGVLVTFWSGPARFVEVKRVGAEWSAELDWESKGFGRNYAIAQLNDGRLYGLRGSFLHVVDAATGEILWRSRPPGAANLVVVDGKVVAIDQNGDVVVGDASGDEWRELARTSALDIDGLTAASYSDGRIFVRNLERLAAVEVLGSESSATAARVSSSGPAPPEGSVMDALTVLGKGDASPTAILDRFLAQRELPIVETLGDATWVHFLWRGEAEDVAIDSAIFPNGEEPLTRLRDTDLWMRSVELRSGGVWTYGYVVDLEPAEADPANPRRTADGGRSWFSTPGWTMPTAIRPAERDERGRLIAFPMNSAIRDNEREIRLILPVGTDATDELSLLVVTDGDNALSNGLANVVDHLHADGKLKRTAVVFVPFEGWPESGFRATEDFASMLAEELVPAVAERLTMVEGGRLAAGGHAVFGPGGGAAGSLVAALRHPGVFARVAIVDLQTWDESEDLLRRVVAEERSAWPTMRMDWSTTGEQNLRLGRSSLTDRAWLPAALREQGGEVESVDFPGGPGYASWRARFEGVVLWLVASP